MTRGPRFYERVSRRIPKLWLLSLAALLFACGRTARVATPDTEKPTNLDLLAQAVTSVAAELVGTAEVEPLTALVVHGHAASAEVASFVETWVVSELQRNSRRRIYMAKADSGRTDGGEELYKLDFTVLQLGVEYAERRGDGLFQRPTVERTARVRMAAKLMSPRERVLWAGERKARVRDRLPVAQVARAEADVPDFARGKVPAPGGLLRTVLEPLVLATAAGAVIYFFFSFRN